jgi:hypothetical protein
LHVGYLAIAGEGHGPFGHEQFAHAFRVTIGYRI